MPSTALLLLPLLLAFLALATIEPVAAFSAGVKVPSSSRLTLLQELQRAAREHAGSTAPLSATIRTAILEGGHRSLTRSELELLLPRDRAPLRASEEKAEGSAARSSDTESKRCLPLGLSLRAYENAVAENHKDVSATLERWRRVVALRQNRVLVPGRAAELYSQLISTLLWADEFEMARQVLQYVGLTSDVYLPSPTTPLVCDLGFTGFKIAKQMLDIPLEKWEHDVEGKKRGVPEPLSPKEQGEAIAEWLWKQVPPEGGDAELEHYVIDMSLAVLRIALREAKARGQSSLTLRLQEVEDPDAPFWGIRKRGILVPRGALEFLRETDAKAVGVALELQEP